MNGQKKSITTVENANRFRINFCIWENGRSKLSSSTLWIYEFPAGLEPAVPPTAYRCHSAKKRRCFGEFVLGASAQSSFQDPIAFMLMQAEPIKSERIAVIWAIRWLETRPFSHDTRIHVHFSACLNVARLMVEGAQHLAGHRGLDGVKTRHWSKRTYDLCRSCPVLDAESFPSRLQLRCFYMLFDCRSISTSQEARLILIWRSWRTQVSSQGFVTLPQSHVTHVLLHFYRCTSHPALAWQALHGTLTKRVLCLQTFKRCWVSLPVGHKWQGHCNSRSIGVLRWCQNRTIYIGYNPLLNLSSKDSPFPIRSWSSCNQRARRIRRQRCCRAAETKRFAPGFAGSCDFWTFLIGNGQNQCEEGRRSSDCY